MSRQYSISTPSSPPPALKTPENLWFVNVLRGYKNGTMSARFKSKNFSVCEPEKLKIFLQQNVSIYKSNKQVYKQV